MLNLALDQDKPRTVDVSDEDPREIDHVGLLRDVQRGELPEDPFAVKVDNSQVFKGINAGTKRRITTELRKRHEGVGGAKSKKQELGYLTGYNAFDVVAPPYNPDYLAQLTTISTPHNSAIKAKTSNIVGLGYTFVESPKTKRKIDDMTDGDTLDKFRKKLARTRDALNDAIDSMNKDDSFIETLVKIWNDYEATGNGYLEIGRTVSGAIGYIGHIPATTMRVRRERDGFVQLMSNKAVFFRNFQDNAENPFADGEPNEIIHLKKYSPISNYYGIPDIIPALGAIAGDEFANRYNLDYFENKAVPRHVITLKNAKLGSGQESALLKFFETGLKGQNHRSIFIPLPADTADSKVEFNIEAIEAGVQESSFTGYHKVNVDTVLMADRVPMTKVSVGEGVALATALDAAKTFKEQVCGPEQTILENKLNKMVKELTDIFIISMNEQTLTDADTQSSIDERDIKNQIRVPNEIRADRGLPGREGGDKPVEQHPAAAGGDRSAARSQATTATARNGRNPKGAGRASTTSS